MFVCLSLCCILPLGLTVPRQSAPTHHSTSIQSNGIFPNKGQDMKSPPGSRWEWFMWNGYSSREMCSISQRTVPCAGHDQPHLPWEGTYWGAAGLPGQDTSCLLFGHVEILQVGIVDVLGESFQVSHLWVLAANLTCCQPCHQLPLLCLWHAPKADCWEAKLGVRTAGGPQKMHPERQPLQTDRSAGEQFVLPLQKNRSAGEHLQLHNTMLLQAAASPD